MSTMTIRRLAVIPALIVGAAFTTACDDDVTEPNDAVVGEFEATEAVFADAVDPNTSFDVIAEDGTVEFDFNDNGTFERRITLPGRDMDVEGGTFERSGNNLLFTVDGDTRTVGFERSGTQLSLDDPNDSFAFDGVTRRDAAFTGTFEQR